MGGRPALFSPRGGSIRSKTHEASHSFGGSLINDYQIEAHMRWWLGERPVGLAGELNVARLIQEMPSEWFSDAQGRARATAALAYCDAWEAPMKPLDQPSRRDDDVRVEGNPAAGDPAVNPPAKADSRQ